MINSLFDKKDGRRKWFRSDDRFNSLYPSSIQELAKRHWTPLRMAKKAAGFLADGTAGQRILDIGSGVGKFCLVAAYYFPKVYWYGIEQRKQLTTYADAAKNYLQLENAFFNHGNFTQLNFKNFDHFYFFNSFYENLDDSDKIDDSIAYSEELYIYYNRYLSLQLEMRPTGTKIATLHSYGEVIPSCYKEVGSEFTDELKFWIKAE
ncbi:MAG: class I SAM-dependent methyltransferase [Bacteroidetes bacterium]|nr:class I SAM-dependent methyltransferase [Bacteroidota bacterium]